MVIVDTHAHIYSPDEQRYPPRDNPRRPPGGKASLKDLRQLCVKLGVDGICAVQTSSFYHFDNRYTVDSSAANRSWVAGVVTLDPDDPESPGLLRRYVRESGIRALRSIPAADKRLVHPGVESLWQSALDLGIVVNVHTRSNDADQIATLLEKYPELPVVLDHSLYPKVGSELAPTLATVRRLSRFGNLHAKLTFIPTGSETGFPCADMHATCLEVVKAFGAERCVWGSNFPNHLWTPRLTFAEHLRIFTDVLPLENGDRAHILGGTANRLYFGGKLKDEAA